MGCVASGSLSALGHSWLGCSSTSTRAENFSQMRSMGVLLCNTQSVNPSLSSTFSGESRALMHGVWRTG
jgi:hypothetical protein